MSEDHEELGIQNRIEPTWEIVLAIWWGYFWRMVVLGGITSTIAALAVGVIQYFRGAEPAKVSLFFFIVTWIWMSFVTLRMVLKSKFHDFRIVIIPRR